MSLLLLTYMSLDKYVLVVLTDLGLWMHLQLSRVNKSVFMICSKAICMVDTFDNYSTVSTKFGHHIYCTKQICGNTFEPNSLFCNFIH